MVAKAGFSTLERFVLVATLLVMGALPAAANTPPQASADSTATHAQTAVLVDVLANDQDLDGDLLTVGITSAPLLGSAVAQEDGTILYTPAPATFEGAGGDSFTYQVSDGRGGTASATVTVSELPVPVELIVPVPPQVLLLEDFETGHGGWSFQDFGTRWTPSDWQVIDGALGQLSNICCEGRGKGTYALWDGGGAWTDYHFRALVRSNDDDAIGLVFRYQDGGNHYRFDWRRGSRLRRLMKLVGNTSIVLAQDDVPYVSGQEYLVEIGAQGNQLEVWIDGDSVFSSQDSSFSGGTIGLLSHGNTGSYFDQIEVTDDSLSELELLVEDFSVSELTDWSVVDFGTVEGPSSWSVVNGEVQQTTNIRTAPFPGYFGTYLLYGRGAVWTDYRFRVFLRSQDDDSIGVVFRFNDWKNHYRFEWNRFAALRELAKLVSGEKVVIAQDVASYSIGEEYELEVTVRGDQIELSLDGRPIFSVTDDSLSSGTIGFAVNAVSGASFDNVRVTALPPQEVAP